MDSVLEKLTTRHESNVEKFLSDEYCNSADVAVPHGVMAVEGENDAMVINLSDDNATAKSISGTLSFKDDQEKAKTEPFRSYFGLPFEGDQPGGVEYISFEVVSAEKTTDGRAQFVLYTVLISRNTGVDRVPATFSKRYSDFDRLNTQLHKKFPELMENIVFPKKQFSGNFNSRTIACRSRAFEQYLSHIFSLDAIRYCEELTDFFFKHDMKQGFNCIHNHDYATAISLLERILPVEEKLLGDPHPDVVATLSALVLAHSNTGGIRTAVKYADIALKCLGQQMDDPYVVPLLQLLIRLCWEIGKTKTDLETRLVDLRQLGVEVDNAPTLAYLLHQEFS